MKDQPMDN